MSMSARQRMYTGVSLKIEDRCSFSHCLCLYCSAVGLLSASNSIRSCAWLCFLHTPVESHRIGQIGLSSYSSAASRCPSTPFVAELMWGPSNPHMDRAIPYLPTHITISRSPIHLKDVCDIPLGRKLDMSCGSSAGQNTLHPA